MGIKSTLLVTALLSSFALSAAADNTTMIGISYNFKSHVGISLRILSSDQREDSGIAAGFSIYPAAASDKKFGFDLGAHRNSDGEVAFFIGGDLIQKSPTVSIGQADLRPCFRDC